VTLRYFHASVAENRAHRREEREADDGPERVVRGVAS
jgi:hypothetical protein